MYMYDIIQGTGQFWSEQGLTIRALSLCFGDIACCVSI